MIKEFILQGLKCASCAMKMEVAIKKVPDVLNVSINLINSKLRIETNGKIADIKEVVEKIVHSYEPEVLVQETNYISHSVVKKTKLLWMLLGAAIFFVAITFEYFFIFDSSDYIALVLFGISYLLLGGKVLLKMIRNVIKGRIFDENFLMGVATIGAILIGKPAEAVTVMLFYQIGEFLQGMAVAKSKKRISDLMDIRPDYANIIKDGNIIAVNPNELKIGDIFIVRPGEKIPLDGIIIEGESMLNTSALTGESVFRKVAVSDQVLSGCINQNGALKIQATQAFKDSTVSKILDLVENAAHKKAPTETFITKFARYYTPIFVGFSILMMIVPPLIFGGEWSDWISRALIFLVISCPCALVVSIPLGFFGGIGGASKKGILIKGGNYLEALANLDIIVFDKTGTLTKGEFKITTIKPANNFNEGELLKIAATAEVFSKHPIAVSILKEYDKEISKENLRDYQEIAGHGVSVIADGKRILAGNEKLMRINGINAIVSNESGTKVYIALGNVFAGCIVISDELKKDSLEAINNLRNLDVRKAIMLTGDVKEIADDIGKQLKLDEVYASLLPQDKVKLVEILNEQKRKKKSLAFVGDGINDAPVLAMADIGIAMGALGSDAAIEAADVVLMNDELNKLAEAVKIARFTKRIVWQNIVMSLGIKLLFLVLATFGVSSLWEAIFADVGVSLLAVLNSMRIIKK
ncbi:MAG: cadmium-translocating P-type ATPase [Erysipelotrichales bacterium]|nr:cadmium-translocating P-type ATPase [Erysipelotrichales bacterium]